MAGAGVGVCYPDPMSVEVAKLPEATSVATRPPRALVVWEPPPEEIGAVIDWSRW